MEKPRIAILCGGRFAFPTLQLLALEKYLCGIALGKADPDAVKMLTAGNAEANYPILSIDSPKELGKLKDWLQELKPDAVFSICFPFRLPEEILALCPGRFINFHTGPLPSYRGPMPIFEVLRSREKQSAICVHLMSENFDEGNIILTENVVIDAGETFGSLAQKLSQRCSLSAQNIAQMIEFGSSVPSHPQEPGEARYFPKPGFNDTLIRWKSMNAEEIEALVNACNPWNTGAETIFNGNLVKIIAAKAEDYDHQLEPGTIISRSEDGLKIACMENQSLLVSILSDESGILPPPRFPRYLSENQHFTG